MTRLARRYQFVNVTVRIRFHDFLNLNTSEDFRPLDRRPLEAITPDYYRWMVAEYRVSRSVRGRRGQGVMNLSGPIPTVCAVCPVMLALNPIRGTGHNNILETFGLECGSEHNTEERHPNTHAEE